MTVDVSQLFDRVPGWTGRARVVGDLEGGITNRNVLVDAGGKRFVVRLAGPGTDLLGVDRHREREAHARAAKLGLAPPVAAFLEPEEFLVTAFVPGEPIPMARMADPGLLVHLAPMLRTFHESGPLSGAFDCFRIPAISAANARGRGGSIPDAYDEAAERAAEIEAAFRSSPEPPVPCHNDLLNANFLHDDASGRIWLLDWEYAGMNDRFFDLGNFAVNNELDDDGEVALLDAYFGAVTRRNRARLALMKIMSDFREAMWGVVQQVISTIAFDYQVYASTHFDRLLRNATAPGYRALLEDAVRPDGES